MNTITVYFNGNGLMVNNKVAEKLSLKNGQNIKTESHFWHILGENASFNLMEIDLIKRSN